MWTINIKAANLSTTKNRNLRLNMNVGLINILLLHCSVRESCASATPDFFPSEWKQMSGLGGEARKLKLQGEAFTDWTIQAENR